VTRILILLNFLIVFAIAITLMVQHIGPKQSDPMIARARLCGAYYEYHDRTQLSIETMEQMCWRTPDRKDIVTSQ